MSKFRVSGDYGYVGFGGMPVLLSAGDEYDSEHDLVQAFPHLFDEVPEPPKRPVLGRPKVQSKDG